MKNYIIAGILLIVLAAASLFLPSSVMHWQDEQRTGKSETEEVQEVVLKEQISMTLSQKLALRNQEMVNAISLVNGKNYNQDTIGKQMRQEVETLAEKGILLDFSEETVNIMDAAVYFYVDMEDSERSVMLWEGYVDTANYTVELLLDDETGKIVSFTQYGNVKSIYDTEPGVDMQIMQEKGQAFGSVTVAPELWNMEREELEELAGRWGEYLGCQVTEFRSIWLGEDPGIRKEVQVRIRELESKGYSWEEARSKTAMEWGIDPDTEEGSQLSAVLEDEGGRIDYVFWSGEGRFQTVPF